MWEECGKEERGNTRGRCASSWAEQQGARHERRVPHTHTTSPHCRITFHAHAHLMWLNTQHVTDTLWGSLALTRVARHFDTSICVPSECMADVSNSGAGVLPSGPVRPTTTFITWSLNKSRDRPLDVREKRSTALLGTFQRKRTRGTGWAQGVQKMGTRGRCTGVAPSSTRTNILFTLEPRRHDYHPIPCYYPAPCCPAKTLAMLPR